MQMVLVRHGTTEAVRERRFQGCLDYALSVEGQREVVLLRERLQGVNLDAVFASPLRRAWQTALPVADDHGLSVTKLKHLREFSWGMLEGRRRKDLRREFPVLAADLESDFRGTPVPDREPYRLLRGRARCAVHYLIEHTPLHGRTLIVSHAFFLNALLAEFLQLQLNFKISGPFVFAPASISIIETDRNGGYRLSLLNDTCHLRGLL